MKDKILMLIVTCKTTQHCIKSSNATVLRPLLSNFFIKIS